MKHILFGALIALGFSFSHASAETCGDVYKIKRGDTLSQIADGLYKDARKWTAVYNANTAVIGDSPNRVFVGMKLQLPCINGLPTGLEGGKCLQRLWSQRQRSRRLLSKREYRTDSRSQ